MLKQLLSYKKLIFLSLLLSILTAISGIGLMITAGYLLSLCAIVSSLAVLQMGITGVRAFGTSKGVFRYFERIISHKLTFDLLKEYRVLFFKKIEKLSPKLLLKYSSSNLLSRLIFDIENLDNIFIRIIQPLLTLLIVNISFFIFLNYINGVIAITISSLIFVFGIVNSLIYFISSSNINNKVVNLNSVLYSSSIDISQGYVDLVSYGRLEEFKNDFFVKADEYRVLNNKLSQIHCRCLLINQLSLGYSIISSIIIFIIHMENSIYNGLLLSMVVFGIFAVYEFNTQVLNSFYRASSCLTSLKRVSSITNGDINHNLEKAVDILKTGENYTLSFDNVYFDYGSEDFKLQNFNLNISKGESIVIKGASGSGKSSLINILAKFYPIQKGNVYIDGVDISNIDNLDVSKKLAFCPQEIYIFNDTIRENISLGRAVSEDKLERILVISQVSEFMPSLEKGLDTRVGEHGLRLSGGQKRRVAIARTLISDAPILFFDEITADIDHEISETIIDSILSLKNKTIIFISHEESNAFKKANRNINFSSLISK